jgi:hypothetical protein
MVMTAQDVWRAVQRVVTDPPTPLGVAIDLTDSGVYPDTDRADESRLTQIGAEAGPEVVVKVRSSVENASVKRQPMSGDTEERNKEGNPDHEKKEEDPNPELPRLATGPSLGEVPLGPAWGNGVEVEAVLSVAAGRSGIEAPVYGAVGD